MDISNLIEEAKRSLAARDFIQARLLFNQVLESDHENLESLKGIGDSYFLEADEVAAREAMHQLIRVCQDKNAMHEEAATYVYMGDAHAKLKNREDALICFKKASEIDPDLAEAYYKRANMSYTNGDSDEAVKYFKIALQINPNHTTALFNLGNTYMEKKQNPEALDCFKKALEINPSDYLSMKKIGIIYTDNGAFEEGISYLTQSLDYMPDILAYNFLAKAYSAIGERDQAIGCIIQVARLGDPKAQQFLANNGINW
ncbi:MAG: tetratricopeptide repeat protein [Candidatus Thiodiazotropha sp.]